MTEVDIKTIVKATVSGDDNGRDSRYSSWLFGGHGVQNTRLRLVVVESSCNRYPCKDITRIMEYSSGGYGSGIVKAEGVIRCPPKMRYDLLSDVAF